MVLQAKGDLLKVTFLDQLAFVLDTLARSLCITIVIEIVTDPGIQDGVGILYTDVIDKSVDSCAWRDALARGDQRERS